MSSSQEAIELAAALAKALDLKFGNVQFTVTDGKVRVVHRSETVHANDDDSDRRAV